MLCSVDRVDEASALIGRAIAGIEQYAGDEDAQLIPVLENAARVAMAMAQPASAEPYLLRMHALLAAHDLPVHRAESLLTRVAQSRADKPRVVEVHEAAQVAAQSEAPPTAVQQLEPDLDLDLDLDLDADYQPLRDAVAVTDVLLRNTPTGSPLVRRDDDADDAWSTVLNETRSHDALEEMRSGAQAPASDPQLEDSEVAETFALELQRDLHATLPSSALGFTVEYGFTGYEEQSRPRLESSIGAELELTDLPTAIPEPEPVIEIFEPMALPVEAPALELQPGGERATFLRPPARRSSPRGVAVVMPSPSAGVPVQSDRKDGDNELEENDDDAAPKNTLVVQDEPLRERRPFGAALRAGRATAPKSSHGVMIAAIVTVAVGGAAAWVYMHGGF